MRRRSGNRFGRRVGPVEQRMVLPVLEAQAVAEVYAVVAVAVAEG